MALGLVHGDRMHIMIFIGITNPFSKSRVPFYKRRKVKSIVTANAKY
jgi:hypothetical protein